MYILVCYILCLHVFLNAFLNSVQKGVVLLCLIVYIFLIYKANTSLKYTTYNPRATMRYAVIAALFIIETSTACVCVTGYCCDPTNIWQQPRCTCPSGRRLQDSSYNPISGRKLQSTFFTVECPAGYQNSGCAQNNGQCSGNTCTASSTGFSTTSPPPNPPPSPKPPPSPVFSQHTHHSHAPHTHHPHTHDPHTHAPHTH